MRKLFTLSALFLTMLFASGCGKGPAEEALKQIDSAVASVKEEGQKYASDQYEALEAAAADAKAKFEAGEYSAVVEALKDVTAKADEVKEAAAAKKDELVKGFEDAKASLPAEVENVEAKLTELGKAKRLPKGVDKAAVEAAGAALAETKALWGEATAAYDAGNYSDALAKAKAAKEKLQEAASKIGLAG